jgi:hypothetical protein
MSKETTHPATNCPCPGGCCTPTKCGEVGECAAIAPRQKRTPDRLFPGNLVTIEGERWEVGAWHSQGGERSVFLILLGNPSVVARWSYDDLMEMTK